MVHTAEGAARRFIARDVRVVGAALDPSGLRVLRLAVGDESDDSSPPSPAEHPSPVSSPAFAEWQARLGTPAALPNIYVPGEPRLSSAAESDLFAGATLDAPTRHYLTVAIDARALRVRARVLQWLAVRAAVDVGRTVRWTSLTCGPAYPMAGAMVAAGEANVSLATTFVDTCADSLDVSRRVALAHGIDPAAHAFVAADAPSSGLTGLVEPESQDLVEGLGMLAGLELAHAPDAISDAFSLVRPGGSLVFSVMLADRPSCECCAEIGWPVGPTLRVDQIAPLLAAAGLPVEDASVFVSEDGVYGVIEVCRL
ncbi:hypothetical protein [Demequina phytophila]|uniref:hypothetical protein n=1 Tax=Demequina phytophila TaxID=1638981 RepID=UPI000784C936|nr:hypothetical protein [Demequina phytophila]